MTTQHAHETGEGEYMSVPSDISEVALIKHCAVSNANLLDRRSGGIGPRVVGSSHTPILVLIAPEGVSE